MKIYGVEPNGKGGFTLTLRDYNEEVYSYGGTIPAYKSNVTRPQAGNRGVSIEDVARLRQDMNVLQEDLINAYQMLEMPIVVDADVKSVIIETNEEGKASTAQTVETQISCRQGWEDRPFVVGSINVPAGWSYEVVGGKVIFTIAEGAEVRSGQFKIPVIYRPIVQYDQYVDENDNSYVDENDANYMALETSSTTYTYDIWFSYFGLQDAVYLGPISNLASIPSITGLNNYFVWTGAETASSLSIEGKFRPARLYKFIGTNKAWKWEVDEDIAHTTFAMGDVLGVADADLEQNNSQAYEYLAHLSANSIFADLLVANAAFINELAADSAFITELTSSSAFINELTSNTVFTDAIKASQGFFENISVSGNSFFQGLLDCGVLQVVRREVENYLFNYAPETGYQRIVTIYNNLSSLGFDATQRNVSTVLASYNQIAMYYGSEQINTVQIDKLQTLSDYRIRIYLNGDLKMGFHYSNEGEEPIFEIWQSLQFYASYKIGTTVVKFSGLPSEAPQESGLLYVDNHILKIS